MTLQSVRKLVSRYRGVIGLAVVGSMFLVTQGSGLLSFVASTDKLGQTAAATMFITPRDESIKLGQTGTLDLQVTTDVPINAIGATVSFDPDALEVVSISKENSFLDLWTEDTAIREDVGEIHFSGGTLRKDGVRGTATILTLAVRAKREGDTEVAFKEAQVLASDGKGSAVENERHTLTLSVQPREDAARPAVVSGDFNGDGLVTITDLYLSVLTMEPFSAYEKRNDLDRNGIVNLADISIFFQMMQR
jgi:hypothetical protein